MTAPVRTIRPLILLMLLAICALVKAAPVPRDWSRGDLPAGPPQWYGVRIAQLPDGSPLALSLKKGLEEAAWGPVQILPATPGNVAVVVGETDDIAQAWYLREELARRKFGTGTLVVVPRSQREPRAFSGPDSRPYIPTKPLTAKDDEIRSRIQIDLILLPDEQAKPLQDALALWERGETDKPALAVAALPYARSLWDRKVEPETSLLIASKIATGEWKTTDDQALTRLQAQDLTFELLYGVRRDWRAAWLAARDLERNDRRDGERQSLNVLRQASLLVDLVDSQHPLRPTFAEIRARLWRAHELAPAESAELKARIELVYLETFAWSGDWSRVQDLAEAMIPRAEASPAHQAMARILLAQSLTRRRKFSDAFQQLDAVINQSPIPEEKWLRMGMTSINPVDMAYNVRLRIRDQAAGFERPVAAPPIQAPAAPAKPELTSAESKPASAPGDDMPWAHELDAPPPHSSD